MRNPATLQGMPSGRRAATPEEFSRICAVTIIAWLPAWVTAVVVCHPPQFALHGWTTLLMRCASFFLLTMAAGAAGLAAAWMGLRVKPGVGLLLVLLHAAIGWQFLPALVLLERTRPAWALPLMAIAAAVTAASLRQMAPADDAEESFVQASSNVLPSLAAPEAYHARLATVRPRRAIVMAACAWTALLLTLASDDRAAGCALALGAFLLLWHWFRDSGIVVAMRPRIRWLSGTAAAAWLVCMVLLLPWMLHGGRGSSIMAAAAVTRNAGAARRVPSHFTSLILWPPKERVTRLYYPATGPALENAAKRRPLEIPFDGPYWYFEPPDVAPDALAHVTHGKPTDAAVNLTSSDCGPLRMQGVERLTKPIDPECCAELDVALQDADAQAGAISLGVVLTDTTSRGQPAAILGFESIGSDGASLRSPRDATVRFPMQHARGLRRFNQITVVIMPTHAYWRGAKVAIDGFTLQPR